MTEHFELSNLELMKKGIELFNAQKYWECHEELEHHWLEEPGNIRNVYWAVIQVAAAMIHYRESNLVGASGLITKAKQKIDRVEKMKLENNIMLDNLDWIHLKNLIRNIPEQPNLLDFKALFEFRFKDPSLWK